MFVHLIADYGVGDPSFAEVIQKFFFLDPVLHIFPTSVPKFSTIATGFWTAQYAFVNSHPDMAIFTNTAPRKDNIASRKNNEGERLVFALLTNGVRVIGVNAGYCFSFIKKDIWYLRSVSVNNAGSQFRSRDFYPEAVVGILANQKGWLGEEIDTSIIPDIPPCRVSWVDGYGNIKTTMRHEAGKYKIGQEVGILLNGIKHPAIFTNGTFSVPEGKLAFALGSSGGKDHPFMELFLRGGSAWEEFGKPSIEDEFIIDNGLALR